MKHFDVNLFDCAIELDPQTDFDKLSVKTPSCKGVILFADSQNTPIQLLTTANIRQTVRAKIFIQDKAKSAKTNLSEVVRKVYYKKCWNDFSAAWWYYKFAKQLYPKDYKKIIRLAKPCYLKFDTSGTWHLLTITDIPEQKNSNIYGLFANRKNAQLYKDLIVETFGLCKKQDCINSQLKAQSCPYYQMGQCDAPCLGKISQQQYAKRLENAANSASSLQLLSSEISNRMKYLSMMMKFEQAQVLKNLNEQFQQKINQYKWINRLTDLSIVHIDIYQKTKIPNQKSVIQFYEGFLIKHGRIIELGMFDIESVGSFIEKVHTADSNTLEVITKQEFYENLSILSFHIYRSSIRGIWLSVQDINEEKIVQKINDTFN